MLAPKTALLRQSSHTNADRASDNMRHERGHERGHATMRPNAVITVDQRGTRTGTAPPRQSGGVRTAPVTRLFTGGPLVLLLLLALTMLCPRSGHGGDDQGTVLKLDERLTALKADNPRQRDWFFDDGGWSGVETREFGLGLSLQFHKNVSDLSALQGLPLTVLSLDETAVSDLTPLAGMPLKALTISGGKVKDLTPLEGMPLETLRVGGGTVKDLTPLTGMPLRELVVTDTGVEDLSPLRGMLSLRSLRLAKNPIHDFGPLRGLKLQDVALDLENAKTRDLSPITGIPARRVTLRNIRPSSLQLLADTPVEILWLEKVTGLTSFQGLRGAPLKQLMVYNTPIKDLAGIEHLPLVKLVVSCAALRDLTPVQRLDKLRALQVIGPCEVSDLSPLRRCQLTHLHLADMRVRDLEPIRDMPLQRLFLAGCEELVDIRPLQGMPLMDLDLSGTGVTDLGALRGLKLKYLVLSNTAVSDVSALAKMPLKMLYLDGTNVTDVRPLMQVPLETLELPKNYDIEGMGELRVAKRLNRLVEREDSIKLYRDGDADNRDLEPPALAPMEEQGQGEWGEE